MKKINGLIVILLAALLLAMVNTGCSAKAKKVYHLQKADRYFDAGQYDEAEAEYMNVLRKYDHENARAIERLGTIYFNEGRLRTSAWFLFKGRALATNDLDLRLRVGNFYLKTGSAKDARAEADFVLARRPQDDQAPILLVAAADTPKGLEEAKQQLQALSKQKDGAGLQVALGSIALRAKDLKSAESAFKRAQTLDPKMSAVWSAMGLLYLVQSNLVQAESALKTAAELAPDRSQEKLQYAEFKLQTGDQAAGKRLLEAMVQKTPDYIPAWMALTKIAADEKKYDECATLLGKVLARDAGNFDALMAGGQLKLTQGKIPEATADFERLAKTYAQAPSAHYQLAVAYLAGNETDKAIPSLNKAVALHTNYFEAELLLDGLQLKSGNVDPAIISLKKLAQQYPQIPQVQLLLAEAYRAQHSFDAALVIYRQMESAFPTNVQVMMLTGTTLLEQKNNAAARNEFTRVLELAPDNFAALEQLVKLDMMENQPAAALRRVQAQLAKNPGQAEMQVLLAQIYMTQGDKTQAQATLTKLVESHPESDIGHMLLARLYIDDKQNQKALAELKMVVAKNPNNEDALLVIGMIYSDEKDYKAARDAYEKLLLINPKSIAALNNLAYLYSEYLDDLGRAYEFAKKAAELLPSDPSTADTLGWILCKRGQYPSAINLLQGSANQLPGEPEVQFHLGWALYMTGEESEAQPALQRAMQSGKEFHGMVENSHCLAVLAVDPKTAGTNEIALLEKRTARQPGDSIAWLRLAVIYQKNGAADKAAAAYESALKANPKSVPALINLAQLYAVKKDSQKAVEMAKAAYKLAPDNPKVLLVLGRLTFETGDYKLSLNLLDTAARNESHNPDVLFDFACAAYAMGQVTDAEAAARSALQAGSAFARADDAKRFLSMTALAANPSSTESQVQDILKAEPGYVPALMAMAGINEQKNDVVAARNNYNKVLGRYPYFAPAQRRLAILCAESAENTPQAYEIATKARAAFPDDPAVAKAFGIIFYLQGDYTRAEKLLNESITASPTDPETLFYLGMSQYHLKKMTICKKNLQQALNLNVTAKFNEQIKKVLAELK